VVVVVAAGEEQLQEVLAQGNLEAILTGGLAAGGVVLVVVLALRRGIRLLEGVGREVERLAQSSLAAPVDLASTPREIHPIAERLNRAMASIAAMIERERRFNADAAHELRTPLSELKAAIDVGLRWPDREALAGALEECRAISRRMEILVESLLHLSRLESADRFEQRELDLARFLRDEVERARDPSENGRELRFSGPEQLRATSSPALWEIVVRNLVENAIEHSPPGSPIEIELEGEPSGPRFSVRNRVEDFDEAMAARCTERFWRRQMHGADGEHFGLGLSIVSAACEKMGLRFRSSYANGVFGAHVEPQAADRRSADSPPR
jgi:two-component system sensor histidine kinase QseC